MTSTFTSLQSNPKYTRPMFTAHISQALQTKEYWIDDNSSIKKQATKQMHTGIAKRLSVDIHSFMDALESADEHTAFSYGVHDESLPDEITITTKRNENPAQNRYSRSRSHYHYSKGAGIMMFDLDPSPFGPALSVNDFLTVWESIDPQCTKATQLIRGSISSGVHLKNEPSPFPDNAHIYIWVANAQDIPRYTKTLANRLWLAGYGFYALSANGGFLDKTVFDLSVFSPEHLDFVGAPQLLDPRLLYSPPKMIFEERGLLQTAYLQDLDNDELYALDALKQTMRANMRQKSLDKRADYNTQQIAKMVARDIPVADAKETLSRMEREAGSLYDDYLLIFSDGIGEVTVRDVLNNPEKYTNKTLYDPLDGLASSPTVAQYYYNVASDTHIIHSFAHGGANYYLDLSALGIRKKTSKKKEFNSMASNTPPYLTAYPVNQTGLLLILPKKNR